MRRWARHQPDIERIAISFTGRSYWLAILAKTQRSDRIQDLRISLEEVRSKFGEFDPKVSFLGEEQRNSLLFTAVDSYVVYAQPEQP